MNPAPTMPTRTGSPRASRALSAVSTMITTCASPSPPERLRRALGGRRLAGRSGRRDGHPPPDLGLDFAQGSPGGVLRRDLGDRQRPLETQTRVAVEQTSLGLRRVEL